MASHKTRRSSGSASVTTNTTTTTTTVVTTNSAAISSAMAAVAGQSITAHISPANLEAMNQLRATLFGNSQTSASVSVTATLTTPLPPGATAAQQAAAAAAASTTASFLLTPSGASSSLNSSAPPTTLLSTFVKPFTHRLTHDAGFPKLNRSRVAKSSNGGHSNEKSSGANHSTDALSRLRGTLKAKIKQKFDLRAFMQSTASLVGQTPAQMAASAAAAASSSSSSSSNNSKERENEHLSNIRMFADLLEDGKICIGEVIGTGAIERLNVCLMHPTLQNAALETLGVVLQCWLKLDRASAAHQHQHQLNVKNTAIMNNAKGNSAITNANSKKQQPTNAPSSIGGKKQKLIGASKSTDVTPLLVESPLLNAGLCGTCSVCTTPPGLPPRFETWINYHSPLPSSSSVPLIQPPTSTTATKDVKASPSTAATLPPLTPLPPLIADSSLPITPTGTGVALLSTALRLLKNVNTRKMACYVVSHYSSIPAAASILIHMDHGISTLLEVYESLSDTKDSQLLVHLSAILAGLAAKPSKQSMPKLFPMVPVLLARFKACTNTLVVAYICTALGRLCDGQPQVASEIMKYNLCSYLLFLYYSAVERVRKREKSKGKDEIMFEDVYGLLGLLVFHDQADVSVLLSPPKVHQQTPFSWIMKVAPSKLKADFSLEKRKSITNGSSSATSSTTHSSGASSRTMTPSPQPPATAVVPTATSASANSISEKTSAEITDSLDTTSKQEESKEVKLPEVPVGHDFTINPDLLSQVISETLGEDGLPPIEDRFDAELAAELAEIEDMLDANKIATIDAEMKVNTSSAAAAAAAAASSSSVSTSAAASASTSASPTLTTTAVTTVPPSTKPGKMDLVDIISQILDLMPTSIHLHQDDDHWYYFQRSCWQVSMILRSGSAPAARIQRLLDGGVLIKLMRIMDTRMADMPAASLCEAGQALSYGLLQATSLQMASLIYAGVTNTLLNVLQNPKSTVRCTLAVVDAIAAILSMGVKERAIAVKRIRDSTHGSLRSPHQSPLDDDSQSSDDNSSDDENDAKLYGGSYEDETEDESESFDERRHQNKAQRRKCSRKKQCTGVRDETTLKESTAATNESVASLSSSSVRSLLTVDTTAPSSVSSVAPSPTASHDSLTAPNASPSAAGAKRKVSDFDQSQQQQQRPSSRCATPSVMSRSVSNTAPIVATLASTTVDESITASSTMLDPLIDSSALPAASSHTYNTPMRSTVAAAERRHRRRPVIILRPTPSIASAGAAVAAAATDCNPPAPFAIDDTTSDISVTPSTTLPVSAATSVDVTQAIASAAGPISVSVSSLPSAALPSPPPSSSLPPYSPSPSSSYSWYSYPHHNGYAGLLLYQQFHPVLLRIRNSCIGRASKDDKLLRLSLDNVILFFSDPALKAPSVFDLPPSDSKQQLASTVSKNVSTNSTGTTSKPIESIPRSSEPEPPDSKVEPPPPPDPLDLVGAWSSPAPTTSSSSPPLFRFRPLRRPTPSELQSARLARVTHLRATILRRYQIAEQLLWASIEASIRASRIVPPPAKTGVAATSNGALDKSLLKRPLNRSEANSDVDTEEDIGDATMTEEERLREARRKKTKAKEKKKKDKKMANKQQQDKNKAALEENGAKLTSALRDAELRLSAAQSAHAALTAMLQAREEAKSEIEEQLMNKRSEMSALQANLTEVNTLLANVDLAASLVDDSLSSTSSSSATAIPPVTTATAAETITTDSSAASAPAPIVTLAAASSSSSSSAIVAPPPAAAPVKRERIAPPIIAKCRNHRGTCSSAVHCITGFEEYTEMLCTEGCLVCYHYSLPTKDNSCFAQVCAMPLMAEEIEQQRNHYTPEEQVTVFGGPQLLKFDFIPSESKDDTSLVQCVVQPYIAPEVQLRKIVRNSPCFTPDCPGKISSLLVKSGRGNQMKILRVLVQFREVNLRRERERLAEGKRKVRLAEEARVARETLEKEKEFEARVAAQAQQRAIDDAAEAIRIEREQEAQAIIQKEVNERKLRAEEREKERIDKAKASEAEKELAALTLTSSKDKTVERDREYKTHLAAAYQAKETNATTPQVTAILQRDPLSTTNNNNNSVFATPRKDAPTPSSKVIPKYFTSPAPLPSIRSRGVTTPTQQQQGVSLMNPSNVTSAVPFSKILQPTPTTSSGGGFIPINIPISSPSPVSAASSGMATPLHMSASSPTAPANWAQLMGGGSSASASSAAAAAALASKLSRKQKKEKVVVKPGDTRPGLLPTPNSGTNPAVAAAFFESPFSILRSDMVLGGLVRCRTTTPTRYLYVQHFSSLPELQQQCIPFGFHSLTSCYQPLAVLIEFEDLPAATECYNTLNGIYFARYADDPLMVYSVGQTEAMQVLMPPILPYMQSSYANQQLSKREKAKLKRQEAIAASKEERIRRRMEKAQYKNGSLGGKNSSASAASAMDSGADGNDSAYEDSPYLMPHSHHDESASDDFPMLGDMRKRSTSDTAGADSVISTTTSSPSLEYAPSPFQDAQNTSGAASHAPPSPVPLQAPRDRDDTFLFSIFSSGEEAVVDDVDESTINEEEPSALEPRSFTRTSSAFSLSDNANESPPEKFNRSESWSLFDPVASPTSSSSYLFSSFQNEATPSINNLFAASSNSERRASWSWNQGETNQGDANELPAVQSAWPTSSSSTNANNAAPWQTTPLQSSNSMVGHSPYTSLLTSHSGALVSSPDSPTLSASDIDVADDDEFDIGGDETWEIEKSIVATPSASSSSINTNSDHLTGNLLQPTSNWNSINWSINHVSGENNILDSSDLPLDGNLLPTRSSIASFLQRSFSNTPLLEHSIGGGGGSGNGPSQSPPSVNDATHPASAASSSSASSSSSSTTHNTVNLNVSVNLILNVTNVTNHHVHLSPSVSMPQNRQQRSMDFNTTTAPPSYNDHDLDSWIPRKEPILMTAITGTPTTTTTTSTAWNTANVQVASSSATATTTQQSPPPSQPLSRAVSSEPAPQTPSSASAASSSSTSALPLESVWSKSGGKNSLKAALTSNKVEVAEEWVQVKQKKRG